MLGELLLRSIPHRAIQNRLVLTGMADALVTDFTDVNRIREQRVKGSSGERVAARLDSAF
jgi:hypothetical protein